VTQSISGLGSGLDTNSIVASLVSIERQSQNLVRARATKAQTALATYTAIRSQLSSVRTAASALRTAADWRPLTATSSDTDVATVSAGTGTFGGTISFTVNALARAGTMRSANVVEGTTTAVNADAAILVSAGGAKLGFASLASDDTLALGSHEITVTQASAAAEKTGTTALAASTVIDGTNDTLNVDVNGVAKVLTIAHGTYDRTQLAAAVQDAADAAGADVAVSVNAASNKLEMATTREGSLATIQVTGGSATSPLQYVIDGSAITGTDGKTQVGSAPEQTWNSIEAGGSVTLNASAGSIAAVFSGGLRTGTLTAKNASTGDGSLATVVANINAVGAGVTATAVQVGDGMYRLQLTSNTVGALNGQSIADSEFNANIGGLTTLVAASDANLTVGSGPGAYTVTSASNTVSNLLPGVSVTLKSESATPVTISASRDASTLAERVQSLVDAANKVKKAVDAATFYDKETNKPSPLTGDSVARRILLDLNRAVTDATSWTTPGSPGLAGLSTDKTGAYTFDASKFTEAFNADPEGMTRLFTQGGTASDNRVTFISSGDRARAGTYDVEVTTVATQATSTGLSGSWPIGSPPTIKVRVGSNEVTYAVGASDVQSDVVSALNSRFAEADLALTASVDGTGIKVLATEYGTAGSFEVAWDGGAYNLVTGTNIAGTIDGVTATGTGQQLSIAFDNATLGGLALKVEATTTGAYGTFTYQPGVAQRIATMLGDATDIVTGYITSSETALKSRVKFIDAQVESMENRLVKYEARLKRQFAMLESTLGMLRQQSDWLAGQVGSLGAAQQG
jgi:flagellar hook-associated protein 2